MRSVEYNLNEVGRMDLLDEELLEQLHRRYGSCVKKKVRKAGCTSNPTQDYMLHHAPSTSTRKGSFLFVGIQMPTQRLVLAKSFPANFASEDPQF